MNASIDSEISNRLMKINQYITLPKSERASKTEDFDNICKYFTDKLKERDPAFAKLYKGYRLAGSYADNLKVGEANEFDLIIRLKIDDSNIEVKNDSILPGYCNINLKNMMIKLKKKCNKDDTKIWYYRHFESLIDAEYFLIQNKVHDWIDRLMGHIVYENLKDGELKFNNNITYLIEYKTSGPAHTINLVRDKRKISIDLVPAFIFDESKWVAERQVLPNIAKIIPKDDLIWIALPKPIKGRPKNNISFITSFVDIERHLIADRNNLKNTLKMLKKLRDRKNLNFLKSYFIKTVYLWENDVQERKFWDKSPLQILRHMITKIIECLKNKSIKFYWHEQQNMLNDLSEVEIINMQNEMEQAYQILLHKPDEVYSLFLTVTEQLKLEENLAQSPINTVKDDEEQLRKNREHEEKLKKDKDEADEEFKLELMQDRLLSFFEDY